MEKKIPSYRHVNDDEKEEDMDRRFSPRNRKRIRYTYEDENVEEEESEDEESEDEEDYVEVVEQDNNKQPGQSTQCNGMNKNGLLSVTCGKKTGRLDMEKLGRGEACIFCKDLWYSPPAFEELGGKGQSRKWKSSILHQSKPLQFWFEQGSLTTKGFKRSRSETTKSSNHELRSHSEDLTGTDKQFEIQSAEETDKETDAEDEDWLPDSDELTQEAEEEEEEREESENGGEAEENSKEMEDDDTPADDDDNVDDRRIKQILSAFEKSALQMKLQVVIERLPEVQTDLESNCKELQEAAGRDAESEEESGPAVVSAESDPSFTAAAHIDPTQTSHSATAGDGKEEEGQELNICFTQTDESKEGGRRQMKSEIVHSPARLSAQAPSLADINPHFMNNNDKSTSTGSDTTNLSSSTGLLVAVKDPGLMWSNMTDVGVSTSQTVLDECKYETSDHDPAQLHVMELQTLDPKTTKASDSPQFSGVDLDSMDLDQLKREKIKMQLKVLRLQEEYYTLQIKKLKQ